MKLLTITSMKKSFIIFVLTFLVLIPQVYAQQNTYWHTSDRYGVELDGEGDAFVVAVLTFEGLQQGVSLNTVNLEIPGTRISVYKAIQVPYSYYGGYYPSQQQNADFITYTLTPLSDSTLITLNLKTPIQPNQQTTVVLIYQTQDIATRSLQGLDFQFQTIKDPNAIIRDVGANVYVPKNMELKGSAKFDIQYKPSGFAAQTAGATALTTTDVSRYISPYYNRPTQYSAQNLDPNESFTVTGTYGDNAVLLYTYEILGTIIVLVVLAWVFRRFGLVSRIRMTFKPKTTTQQRAQAPRAVAPSPKIEFSWMRVIISGGGSGFLYVIAALLTQFIFSLLQNIGYQFQLLAIVLVIVLFIVPLMALFLPAIYLAKNYSWKEGILTFIIAIVTAIALLYLVSLIYPIFRPTYGYGGAIY